MKLRMIKTAVGLMALAGVMAAAPGQIGDLLKQKPKEEKKDDKGKVPEVIVNLPPYNGPKKRLAVADMELKITVTQTIDPTANGGSTSNTTISIPPPTDFSQGLTEMLTNALMKTNRFVMLERSTKGMEDIKKEQALEGVTDETKAANNRMMGAQLLVRGAVTEYSYKSSSQGGNLDVLRGIGVTKATSEAMVVIDIRIYDAATGEILYTEKAPGVAKATATAVKVDKQDFKVGGSQFNSSPLGAATRQAIEKAVIAICKSMEAVPWEARVADIIDEGNGTQLVLTCGRRTGIKVGDIFEVWIPGKAIMDPENPGHVIGRTKGRKIGMCKIVTVDENISYAVTTEGQHFEPKYVIRIPEGRTLGG